MRKTFLHFDEAMRRRGVSEFVFYAEGRYVVARSPRLLVRMKTPFVVLSRPVPRGQRVTV